jgi:sugar phosphate isomerase/epimerase
MAAPQKTSRRDLLRSSTLLAGLAAASPLFAIEPIVRPSRQRMRLSLAAYSMRKYLQAKSDQPGAMDLPAFIDWAAGLDLDAVELTAYYFPPNPEPTYLAQLKRSCHIAGLDISGGAIGNNFTHPDGPELERQMDYTKTWIERYAALGVTTIRVFAGVPPKGTSEEEGVARAVRNLRAACEYAGRFGVILAIENHDYLTRIDRLLEVVRQVDSPWFGVNLDSANVSDPQPYEALAKIAPYAVNVQVKTEIPTGRGGKEPVDLSRVMNILRDVRYSGYVVLEYEGGEEPYDAVPRHLSELRSALA